MEKLVCIRNQTEKFISIDIPKYGGFFLIEEHIKKYFYWNIMIIDMHA